MTNSELIGYPGVIISRYEDGNSVSWLMIYVLILNHNMVRSSGDVFGAIQGDRAMMHGNVISNQNSSFSLAGTTSSSDVPLDKFGEKNRFLVRLYSYCTAIGTVIGALIAIYVLQNEFSGATLFAAAFSYSSVGAITGILMAGFYDVMARRSLDTWVGDK